MEEVEFDLVVEEVASVVVMVLAYDRLSVEALGGFRAGSDLAWTGELVFFGRLLEFRAACGLVGWASRRTVF